MVTLSLVLVKSEESKRTSRLGGGEADLVGVVVGAVGVVGVMEDEAVLRKGSSDSGLTSLTADFLFLVGVFGTSKKDA